MKSALYVIRVDHLSQEFKSSTDMTIATCYRIIKILIKYLEHWCHSIEVPHYLCHDPWAILKVNLKTKCLQSPTNVLHFCTEMDSQIFGGQCFEAIDWLLMVKQCSNTPQIRARWSWPCASNMVIRVWRWVNLPWVKGVDGKGLERGGM